jgi:hypothetical protein
MSAFDSSSTSATTLPSWFTSAQQNIGQAATGALSNAINPQSTVAQGVVESLGSGTNPFTQGTATLQNIASGIANPWLPNGQPNTNTTLGGLFASENAQLNQMLPTIAATQGAAGIGSGQTGSLRDQTAIDAAKAGALTNLAANQNVTAENALTQAIQAEAGAGNLESQYGTTGINTANFQQLGALPAVNQAATALSNIGQTVPKTTTTSTNQGLTANLTQAGNLVNNLGNLGQGALNALTGTGTSANLPSWLANLLSPSNTPTYTGTYQPIDTSSYGGGGNYSGYTTGSDTNATAVDASGNPIIQ